MKGVWGVVLRVFEGCLEGVWGGVWRVFGGCLGVVWGIFYLFFGGFLIFWGFLSRYFAIFGCLKGDFLIKRLLRNIFRERF